MDTALQVFPLLHLGSELNLYKFSLLVIKIHLSHPHFL
nr:MAG TPA: hypothetical protein [Caudoviricetes sp.]